MSKLHIIYRLMQDIFAAQFIVLCKVYIKQHEELAGVFYLFML